MKCDCGGPLIPDSPPDETTYWCEACSKYVEIVPKLVWKKSHDGSMYLSLCPSGDGERFTYFDPC